MTCPKNLENGSVIRSHRSASGRLLQSEENDELNALGRSRGGYSTKLHVLTDSKGSLLAVTAAAGQRNESTEFENLLANCELSLHRKAKRPKALAGDKGYHHLYCVRAIRSNPQNDKTDLRDSA